MALSSSLLMKSSSMPPPHGSSVISPRLCVKKPILPSIHKLFSSGGTSVVRRHSCSALHSSRAQAKFGFVDKRLGMRVENVASPPAASPPIKNSEGISGHSETFLNVLTEKELLLGIQKEVESKRIPPKAGYAMEELYRNYRDAVVEGGASEETTVKIMATVLDRVLLQFKEPFTFPAYHKAIREPYDYYGFGQNYIRPLLDFRNSYLGNVHFFDEIEGKLTQGDNVVLLANHQTEADPAVIALLLESSHPYISQSLIYIAGDRVVADPFCKPFSMGRNLLCVYSKKHVNDEPELVDMKRKANARSLKELALMLRKGGQLIWIAPSGGRDRPDLATSKWKPALFDTSSVENMRRLIEHSKAPGHLYSMALLCYGVMPPPTKVEKEIGEKRLLGYTAVGVSVSAELNFNDITSNCTSPDEAAEFFAQTAWQRVNGQYDILVRAVEGREGTAASTSAVVLSQPWTATRSLSSSVTPNGEHKILCHSS